MCSLDSHIHILFDNYNSPKTSTEGEGEGDSDGDSDGGSDGDGEMSSCEGNSDGETSIPVITTIKLTIQ